jgi:fermentation-respiration switch protein FrsA (DUF1100 family)
MPQLNPQTDKNGDGKLDIANEIVPEYQALFKDFDRIAAQGPYSQYPSDKTFPTVVATVPKYKGPVLILQGTSDANVSPDGAKQIDDAVAALGNSGHTLHMYRGLVHSLGVAPTVYQDNFQPIDMAPLQDTLGWLGAHARK